jgi:energy-converting hydrogenase Eha subunit F
MAFNINAVERPVPRSRSLCFGFIMNSNLLNTVSELFSPQAPATVSQIVTAICMGVRLEPQVFEKTVSSQIADAELHSADSPNEMQRILAADLGVAFDAKATRGSVCMQLMEVYHTNPATFASYPSRAFQDRFCGGPFERFGNWLPAHAKTDLKSQFPQASEAMGGITALCITLAVIITPFVLLWYAGKALWAALFG